MNFVVPFSFTGGVDHYALRQIAKMAVGNINGDNSEPSLNLKKVASERGFEISDNRKLHVFLQSQSSWSSYKA